MELSTLVWEMDRCGGSWFRLCGALIAAGYSSEALEAGQRFIDGFQKQWPHLDAELGAKALANMAMVQRNVRKRAVGLKSLTAAVVRYLNLAGT